MKLTGQILKENRENLKKSVGEVSVATKINPKLVIALEEGDLNALPSKTFIRGFVRTYALYLKIDVEAVLSTYHEEMGSTLPKSTGEPPSPHDDSTSKFLADPRSNYKTICYAGGLIALITTIIFANNLYNKYQMETTRAEPTNEKLEQKVLVGKTVATGPVNSPPSDNLNEPGTNTTTQNNNIPPEVAPPTTEDKQKVLTPTKPTAVIAAKKNIEVIIEALDQVKLKFKIDGGTKKTIVLDAEAVHTIKGKVSVLLDLSDGGAVNIIHNGVDIGVPGDLGKAKSIKF